MTNLKIIEGLERRLNAQDCNGKPFRLVFWQEKAEAMDLMEYGVIFKQKNWDLIDLAKVGPLALKSRILEEPDTRFVVLQMGDLPQENRDPLLDLRLAYPTFTADQWTLYLDEMGLGARPDLQEHIKTRNAFFRKKDHREALVRLGLSPQETPETLDLKILAVLAKASESQIASILIGFLDSFSEHDDLDEYLAAYDMSPIFWLYMKSQYYFDESKPTLEKLALKMLCTDLAYTLEKTPAALASYVLPVNQTAFRFCQLWRNSRTGLKSYKRWIGWMQDSLGSVLDGVLSPLLLEYLLKIRTLDVEKRILSHQVKDLNSEVQERYKKVLELVETRKDTDFWLVDDSVSQSYKLAHQACGHAVRFYLDLELFHPEAASTLGEMADLYLNSWYRLDQAYRLYLEATESLASWDLFKDLTARIEDLYLNTYLQRLGAQWDSLVTKGQGTLDSWAPLKNRKQSDFFSKHVRPYSESGEKRRAFVIISDALRYEVGQELSESLKSFTKLKVELSSLQTVLPSITKLGMAALLPHGELSMLDSETVLVDGKSSTGLESRRRILEPKNGLALDALELLAMKREDSRALVKEYSLIYIYHDKIDALGDKQSSEDQTFRACRETIDDITRLINYIFNTLQGSHVLVTGDHGFIYTNADPEATHKSALPSSIPGAQESKKRYILGQDMAEYPGTIRGNLAMTFGTSPLNFLLPMGTQRFHFKGGAMFFHGGIMPQEVLIPLLTIKPEGDSTKPSGSRKKVEVGVFGFPQTITTRVVNVKVHQEDPVGDQFLPRQVRMGVYLEGKPVSDEELFMANVSDSDHKALRKTFQLHLLGESFDSKILYRFSLKDEDSGVEIYGQDVRISLMITDEF